MQNTLVVADDLTGAMDTAHGFAARGRGVRVRLRGERGDASGPATRDVLAVDTDSREAAPAVAAEAVTRAIDAHPADLVYKKVDSTLRGNVVSEVDAAVAATGADVAVVAPAFPDTGRTTEDGTHLVDGAPLADAGYGVDESDLLTVFSGSRYVVGHLPLGTVRQGATAVREALADLRDGAERPFLAVCDATTDEHLAVIAAGAAAFAGGATASDAGILFVGSGGLAKHVAVPGEGRPTAVGAAGRPGTLAVVGSTNERTLVQLAAVPEELVVKLDPAAAVRDPAETGRRGAVRLKRLLDRGDRAVVTAARTESDVERARTAADETGADAGGQVATALATAASGAVAAGQPGGLVLTGGAVARAVLTRLEAPELALTGRAVADGVPESVVARGPAQGTRVVTKAGGFGDERTLLDCLDAV
ncbi:MAG: four-carbon acid sugar kinase family protein [Haloferacaceae archaeon]